jgi:hypothetical protein
MGPRAEFGAEPIPAAAAVPGRGLQVHARVADPPAAFFNPIQACTLLVRAVLGVCPILPAAERYAAGNFQTPISEGAFYDR